MFPAIAVAAPLLLPTLPLARGAGVTIITHGFNGNVTDWVIPMAQQIPAYGSFPGSNYSCYQITVDFDFSHNLTVTQSRIGGLNPTNSDSGEILIKLDWSSPSVDPTVSTTDIAAIVMPKLLATNFVPELGGRSLVEFPIHLIGHSRGGSVMTEMSRLLGEQGVWVDHLTTLDPHPVSEYGDADVHTFVNVLFADNYWQVNSDSFCPNGQSLAGAFNRFLANLSGGYSCNHEDVHLWYHGTIDWSHTPASDTQTTITSAERTNWWTGYEAQGHFAGFYYCLIAGGNRLSTDEPAGEGTAQIRDGYNQVWDFGAGTSGNRRALPANNGSWPDLIRFDLLTHQPVSQADDVSFDYFFQLNQPASSNAAIQVYLDNDANPYDGNQGQIFQSLEQGTGTNVIQRRFSMNTASLSPGQYFVYARITYASHTRYLYAPGKLIISSMPALQIIRSGDLIIISWTTNAIGFNLEGTPDFILPNSWSPVSSTPVVVNGRNTVTNTIGSQNQFYRLRK